ncbi:hypothetical protein [Natrialba asiatica]|uniref:PH domain-containing protein n=1 Tax=Natrialba asiatica (strain ATCC 700177 / DSM 12278 / JCM 9576 / FERM P-10747 / NBRC 102637 / 172P1) TaxID=29540 RepID=M0AIG5_NATA1|nr:hypothetical protein [Natrialba asiatica]ELY98146.1 hypothetical protein C481_19470 [Natrialba asiatica DSM 12278]
MNERSSAEGADGGTATASVSAAVERRILAGYIGVVFAAVALTGATALNGGSVVLAGGTLLGLFVGIGLGTAVHRRFPDLPARLGRGRVQRAAPFAPAVPFGLVGLASVLGPVDTALGLATAVSASGLLVAGYVLLGVTETGYAADRAHGRPIAACRWHPPRTPKIDVLLLVVWPALALLDAIGRNWLSALVWGTLWLCWLVGGFIEGRFRVGETGTDPEIRLYENGLVKQRPYTSRFVPWDEIDHVRLRDDELVFDRGLFDVRLDRESLDAPEAIIATVEQRLSDRTTALP